MELQPLKDNGVLIRDNLPTDWVAGQETGIIYKENIKDGQWDDFLPSDERQSCKNFDSNSCVTFSALNCCEIMMNRMLSLNLIPDTSVQWLKDNGYVDEFGKVNFSDRFTAKMSGTKITGNYLGAVWDSIRNHGVLPERDYPFGGETWEEYMAEIPQELKDKALKFKEYFEVKYEWIPISNPYLPMVSISKHLCQSPIQIASATCSLWNTAEIINGCGIRTNHATTIYGYTEQYIKDYDHYNPFRKKLGLDYAIPYAIKGVVEVKQAPATPQPFKHTFTLKMEMGTRGSDIVALQDFLKIDGDFPLDIDSTGYYGEYTRQAVKKFQEKYKVANIAELTFVNGKWCGQKTINELNRRIELLKVQ